MPWGWQCFFQNVSLFLVATHYTHRFTIGVPPFHLARYVAAVHSGCATAAGKGTYGYSDVGEKVPRSGGFARSFPPKKTHMKAIIMFMIILCIYIYIHIYVPLKGLQCGIFTFQFNIYCDDLPWTPGGGNLRSRRSTQPPVATQKRVFFRWRLSCWDFDLNLGKSGWDWD